MINENPIIYSFKPTNKIDDGGYQCKFRGVDGSTDPHFIAVELELSFADLKASLREAFAERRGSSLLDRAKSKVIEWLTGLSNEDIERLKRK